MDIKNLQENDDGSVDFDFKVDSKETEFLLTFAIKALIREGIIKTGEEEIDLQQMEQFDRGLDS
jgi:hypothetical protein|tara:strand:- start:2213 stop:2404 length:192 start_codon:yes stop_codon:yes gene_type:complete